MIRIVVAIVFIPVTLAFISMSALIVSPFLFVPVAGTTAAYIYWLGTYDSPLDRWWSEFRHKPRHSS